MGQTLSEPVVEKVRDQMLLGAVALSLRSDFRAKDTGIFQESKGLVIRYILYDEYYKACEMTVT
jgi:hypothetical protein